MLAPITGHWQGSRIGTSPFMKERAWVDRTPVHWETIPPSEIEGYLSVYFDGASSEATHCDVFFVWQLPAAAILCNDYTTKGVPVVTDVYMNKSLLILSGMANAMRSTLAERRPVIRPCRERFKAFYEIP